MESSPDLQIIKLRDKYEEWEIIINGIMEFASLEVEKLRKTTFKWKLSVCIVLLILCGLGSALVSKEYFMTKHVLIFASVLFCTLSVLYYLDFEHVKVNIPHWEKVYMKARTELTLITSSLNMLEDKNGMVESVCYLLSHRLNHDIPLTWLEHFKVFENTSALNYIINKFPDDTESQIITQNKRVNNFSILIC